MAVECSVGWGGIKQDKVGTGQDGRRIQCRTRQDVSRLQCRWGGIRQDGRGGITSSRFKDYQLFCKHLENDRYIGNMNYSLPREHELFRSYLCPIAGEVGMGQLSKTCKQHPPTLSYLILPTSCVVQFMDVHVLAEVYCVIVSISTSTPTHTRTVKRNESTVYVVH